MPSRSFFYSFLFLFLVFSSFAYSEGDKTKTQQKTSYPYAVQYSIFNANNVSTYVRNNGEIDNSIHGDGGFEYPVTSNKKVIFQSGFMWGGLINGETRAGGSFYRSGLTPGSILENGEPEDPNSPSARVFRVRRDYRTSDLANEIATDTWGHYMKDPYQEIFSQYEKDWNEWPAEKGAPFEDLDNDGKYNPAIDIPGVPGALQTLWFSANDANSIDNFYSGVGATKGMELRVTFWGYGYPGAIGNTIFRRYILINKSQDTLKNAYVALPSDPEIGEPHDDLAGCDTILSLAYNYNSDHNDPVYGNYSPAAGFMLVQGPIAEGSFSDMADFMGRKIQGMKNLPMTSSALATKYDENGGADFGYYDPKEVYNYMQGLRLSGEPIELPKRLGGGITKFLFPGDPVTGEGWIDGIEEPPYDRRSIISSGPFTLMPADTQEVIYACIAAGYIDGLSNIKAVGQLKLYANNIKNVYQKLNFINDMRNTVVNVFEGDREITLSWGENKGTLDQIENFDRMGIKFEGYNVYQAPSLNPKKDEIVKIAVFDKVNGIRKVYQPYIAADMDIYGYKTVQHGTDSGIKRHVTIERDSLDHNKYLRNGSKYYFAVTAYYIDEGNEYYPSYESPLNFMEVVPQIEKPGVRYGGKPGDKLAAEHIFGQSENSPDITIVNPAGLTGHVYEITFSVDERDSVYGKIKNKTTGKENPLLILDDPDYPGIDIDGLNFVMTEKGRIKKVDYINPRNLSWTNGDDFELESFYGAIGWSSPRQKFGDGKNGVSFRHLKKVELRFAEINDTSAYNPPFNLNDPDISFAYRYGRNFDKAAAKPEFASFINNTAEGFSYQGYEKSVPLSAWDVEDSLNPRRLSLAYLENNVPNGLTDGKYWPPINYINNTKDTSACEWLWILDEEYTETPNSIYQGNAIEIDIPAMYWITATRRTNWYASTMTILPYRLLTENDVYSFTSPQNTYSLETAKADVNKINVFPNPYYCRNIQETQRYQSFVTFNHLPEKAVIRIFNIGGQLIRTLHKDSPSQYFQWDLKTDSNYPAGSGMYIALIELPDLGKTKTLKLAIIQGQLLPDRF